MITETETMGLLSGMAAGDQSAASQFYIAYRPILKSFLSRGGCDVAIVEDAIQETMNEVWNHPERFKPGGKASFKTWFLSIGRFKLTDQLRKKKIQTVELDEALEVATDDEGFEAMNSKDRKRAIKHCMETLKGKYRQLLSLAYEHELPGSEISRLMDIPVGSVKSALHNARHLFKKCLERNFPGVHA